VKVIHVGSEANPEANNPDDDILVTAVLTHPVSSVVHSTLIFPRTKILELLEDEDQEDQDQDQDQD
jgi:hypothetical protein